MKFNLFFRKFDHFNQDEEELDDFGKEWAHEHVKEMVTPDKGVFKVCEGKAYLIKKAVPKVEFFIFSIMLLGI